jgi:hypothetical protein
MLRAVASMVLGLILIGSIPGCGAEDEPEPSGPPAKIKPSQLEAPAPPPPPGE